MIPRTLHQVWVGGPMPDVFAEWRAQWIAMHPTWEHVLWTDENMPPLRNAETYAAAERLVGRYAGQLRSDIARYEILHAHGGVYVDTDCEPRRPLDELLGAQVFVGWEVPGVWANNAVIGAVPAHPFLEALIDRLPASVERNKGKRPNAMTGPRFLTPIAAEHDDVSVYPRDYFYPYGHDELDRAGESFPTSFCVHHWQNTRTRRKAPLR